MNLVFLILNRFNIASKNKDSLLQCVMPYHNTKLMVKFVHIIAFDKKIEHVHNKWNWLHQSVQVSFIYVLKVSIYLL